MKKLVLYRFLRNLNFQQVIFQKIVFKSVYILVTTSPTHFFGSYLCLESKTIFIFTIALTVWSETKCTTHQVGILSVRDISVEVSKIMEGKPFITIFDSNNAHLTYRNKKIRFQRILKTIISAETTKPFGQP